MDVMICKIYTLTFHHSLAVNLHDLSINSLKAMLLCLSDAIEIIRPAISFCSNVRPAKIVW